MGRVVIRPTINEVPMSCHRTSERIVGPVCFRDSGELPQGAVVVGHTHNFDHATMLLSGAVSVREIHPGGSTAEHSHSSRGDAWETKAEVVHEITALVDGTEFTCVFPHREPDGTVIPAYKGYEGAYR
jgi:hypothetical protein